MRKNIIFFIGTRPEAIKVIPVYLKFKNDNNFNVRLCITAQHREILDDVLKFFNIDVDYDLNIMKENQSLEDVGGSILKKVSGIFKSNSFDLAFVHGDTSTTFFCSLAAFYNKVDVAHIEAGLRTYDIYSPFPEEINRQLTARIAKYHFTPTEEAKSNLLNERLNYKNIYVVGNTVIDMLLLTLKKIKLQKTKRKYILITVHRRENFGYKLLNICKAIKELALKYKNFDFIYPVHPNPNVKSIVLKELFGIKNVKLINPLTYPDFISLMANAYIILTDSGGVQEEAPTLKKPILILRDTTERPEIIKFGFAKLIGTEKEKIVSEVEKLINDEKLYNYIRNKMKTLGNPYGDGKASERIYQIIKEHLVK